MAYSTPSPPSPRTGGVRQTEPQGINPHAQNGFGLIPRRGTTYAHDLCDRSGVQRMAWGSPLRLLKVLPDVHPSVGLALWNALRLSCAPGDLVIQAVQADGDTDPDGTAAIADLWKSLPSEIGGLTGLQTQLTQEAVLTGLCCAEAVPGGRLGGVAHVWPVDSLSIAFKRDRRTGEAMPLQRQHFADRGRETEFGHVVLNTETFFWRAVDSMVDEPYGRAPYASALTECLADIAMMMDLRQAMHVAAYPRLAIGFNWTETYKIAKEQHRLQEPKASEWVQERFRELVASVGGLNPDDSIFHPHDADVKSITPGDGFQAINQVMQFLRQRITQALKTLPTLMGINDGSTQTYTTVEWAIYAAGLESIGGLVDDVLVSIASLHLRLLGLPLTARADRKSIRTSDGFVEAQAETIRIKNAAEKVRLGWISHDQASHDITGSEPVAPHDPAAYAVRTTSSKAPENAEAEPDNG
ncbi:hypothetical protein EON79_03675 [bacterium]|nr:MAG: hypothetical protein EON79_03675 [bacterium]